jgi:hypothetical protein
VPLEWGSINGQLLHSKSGASWNQALKSVSVCAFSSPTLSNCSGARRLEAVHARHLVELQRFARGILKDYDAVVAGLTQIYSNGPVKAQVHKLKLVKRAMFGRAKLPLLRQRLLQVV